MSEKKQIITGFLGNMGSGKTYMAQYLYHYHPTLSYLTNFAKPIKEIALAAGITKDGKKKISPIITGDEMIAKIIQKSYELLPEIIVDKMFRNKEKCYTLKNLLNSYAMAESNEVRATFARKIYQFIGTEMGREEGSEDIWVLALDNDVEKHASKKRIIIIDDVRFLNEAKFVKQNNGYIIRLIGEKTLVSNAINQGHPSETELLTIDENLIDKTILNEYKHKSVLEMLKFAEDKIAQLYDK